MNYRKIGGLHWFAIGRLRIAFCVTRKVAPEGAQSKANPLLTYSDTHYKPLPRANWPTNRAIHYGEAAVERALFTYTEDDL